MTYNEAVEYLYNQTPQFQRIGAAAYKPGLDTVSNLSSAFGNPQDHYPTIHVGGTNGKGSTAHTLAAVLMSAGYKVGLYTSPHLVDFRERIRVNGRKIPHDAVSGFVERYQQISAAVSAKPSFFELTTVMAFDWFAKENVDVAVIEVGLGGRLDSTNIITPCLSVITNISFDHMAQLGDTLEKIASEKAGIIKPRVPLVCGETKPEIKRLFASVAKEKSSPAVFAQEEFDSLSFSEGDACLKIDNTPFGLLNFQLTGLCQRENARTILASLCVLRRMGWNVPDDAVRRGFAEVCTLTGLMGRWMRLSDNPLTVCDTGHNEGGWEKLSVQLASLPRPLVMVLGFVNDKDVSHIFPYMPADAKFVFTRASIPRALPAQELAAVARRYGIDGIVTDSVAEAWKTGNELIARAGGKGALFIGGSTFVVADLLADCYSTKIS